MAQVDLSSDASCVPCPGPISTDSAQHNRTTCPPDCIAGLTFLDTIERVCKDVQHCVAGEYVAREPSAMVDRLCEPCNAGINWSDTTDAPKCHPCTASCIEGLSRVQGCTATDDTHCKDVTAPVLDLGDAPTNRTYEACVPRHSDPSCSVYDPTEARDIFNGVDKGRVDFEAVLDECRDDKCLRTPGVYLRQYTSSDDAENTATASRSITVVDTTAPEVLIVGHGSEQLVVVEVEQGDGWSDLGATAWDLELNLPVRANGNDTVDTLTAGAYVINYTAIDGSDNVGWAALTVVVIAPPTIDEAGGGSAGAAVRTCPLQPLPKSILWSSCAIAHITIACSDSYSIV